MADEATTGNKFKNLFDTLWNGAEELLKGIEKPFIERKLKREFAAARDAALMSVDTAHKNLSDLRKQLKDYPLEEVLEQRQNIRDLMTTVQEIEAEYADLFGKKMTICTYED